jgi:hypothetical protein
MTEPLPFSHPYNLARLGQAGDVVTLVPDTETRAAIARWAGILALEGLTVEVTLSKTASTRFKLIFRLVADLTQACVVTLEPVPAHIRQEFIRELHFSGPRRRLPAPEAGESAVTLVGPDDEEGPEEIESLHYDLAGPVLEELVLALDPYPRCPGVEFAAEDEAAEAPESPFAVLKRLKPGS